MSDPRAPSETSVTPEVVEPAGAGGVSELAFRLLEGQTLSALEQVTDAAWRRIAATARHWAGPGACAAGIVRYEGESVLMELRVDQQWVSREAPVVAIVAAILDPAELRWLVFHTPQLMEDAALPVGRFGDQVAFPAPDESTPANGDLGVYEPVSGAQVEFAYHRTVRVHLEPPGPEVADSDESFDAWEAQELTWWLLRPEEAAACGATAVDPEVLRCSTQAWGDHP